MTPPNANGTSMLSLRTLGFAGTALLVIGGACSKQKAARGRPPVPVPVTRAHKADLPYTIDANGVVVPYQSAGGASQEEGIIPRLALTEGRDGTPGGVLFPVDQG